MLKEKRVLWRTLNYNGITEETSMIETKERVIKNNPQSPFLSLIKKQTPKMVRGQFKKWLKSNKPNSKKMIVPATNTSLRVEILSAMAPEVAASILLHL